MIEDFDPRLTPARSDLAAAHLRGKVEAAAYVEGTAHTVIAGAAPMRSARTGDAALASEALFGERFTVYEARGDWVWGQLETDGYVGYLPAQLVVPGGPRPTHRIAALRTHLYAGPDIKGPVLAVLSMNARVAVADSEGMFSRLSSGGFAITRHLAGNGGWERDFVAVAERFVGTPYLWGGRTSIALDCSALVQLSLAAAGIAAPRDSDLQERELGVEVAPGEARRGDLVFWKGHVAIMADDGRIVHANAHHMATVIEPLAGALQRIAADIGEVSSVRRPRGA